MTKDKLNNESFAIKKQFAKSADALSDIARGAEAGAGGTLVRKGSNYSAHVNDAHKASKAKMQDSIQRVEKEIEAGKSVSKGTGDVTPKKKSVPDWLKERWEAGNNFNKENRPRYPYNEVELEAKEVGGKKYVVDSYAPNKEIVSRKFTQLSEVQEKTAKSYLNEITKKYSSGSKISNGTFNPNAL
ncbi:hypothetical protein CHCC14821_1515 [Bacillus paralicheniformis]|nr:hypothetical protein CHCC14821_1515 [Bacillus paralicheniformis]